ncbi:NOP58 family protein [archaeon]|nr:NOP58 family protein [archaeon]
MSKFEEIRKKYLRETREKLSKKDIGGELILQSFKSLKEVEQSINELCTKLREWYGYYYPELEHENKNNEEFVKKVLENPKRKISIGYELFKEKDVKQILIFAEQIQNLFNYKKKLEQYLDILIEESCPNTKVLAGSSITCLMLEQAGSLKNLMEMPSSTIQLLGAEKALFRHLKGEGKSPKFGFLYGHELVKRSKDKGKIAKLLADKISIAIKIDYFKGKFIGDKLRKEIEKKLTTNSKPQTKNHKSNYETYNK